MGRVEQLPAPKKYFTHEDWISPKLLPPLSYEDLLSGIVYSPSTVIHALCVARDFLSNTPGCNREFRREHSESWLGPWIDELSTYDSPNYPFMKTFNVIDPIRLSDILYMSGQKEDGVAVRVLKDHLERIVGRGYLREQHIGALWFVAGLEGNECHRGAMDFVLENCVKHNWLPIIMFEDPTFIARKDRLDEFLPLPLRMSMWSHYCRKRQNKALITINPESCVPKKFLDEFYESLFRTMHGRLCFSNKYNYDPTFVSKFFRGDFSFTDLQIPHFDGPSTTDRVRI